MWGFYILAFAQGWGFVEIAPKEPVFVYKRFLPFLEFQIIMARTGDYNILGCYLCSQILYVQKKIIQS